MSITFYTCIAQEIGVLEKNDTNLVLKIHQSVVSNIKYLEDDMLVNGCLTCY